MLWFGRNGQLLLPGKPFKRLPSAEHCAVCGAYVSHAEWVRHSNKCMPTMRRTTKPAASDGDAVPSHSEDFPVPENVAPVRRTFGGSRIPSKRGHSTEAGGSPAAGPSGGGDGERHIPSPVPSVDGPTEADEAAGDVRPHGRPRADREEAASKKQREAAARRAHVEARIAATRLQQRPALASPTVYPTCFGDALRRTAPHFVSVDHSGDDKDYKRFFGELLLCFTCWFEGERRELCFVRWLWPSFDRPGAEDIDAPLLTRYTYYHAPTAEAIYGFEVVSLASIINRAAIVQPPSMEDVPANSRRRYFVLNEDIYRAF